MGTPSRGCRVYLDTAVRTYASRISKLAALGLGVRRPGSRMLGSLCGVLLLSEGTLCPFSRLRRDAWHLFSSISLLPVYRWYIFRCFRSVEGCEWEVGLDLNVHLMAASVLVSPSILRQR
jgi:hypothetical protein